MYALKRPRTICRVAASFNVPYRALSEWNEECNIVLPITAFMGRSPVSMRMFDEWLTANSMARCIIHKLAPHGH
jgi:hypothetical protein